MEAVSLGSYLRTARQNAGLTVEMLAQRTKIPLRLLEAVEAERFAELPPPVYLKGFVRSICAVTRTDPAPALATLEDGPAPGPLPAIRDDGPYLATNASIFLSRSTPATPRGLRWSHLALVLIAVVVLGLAWAMTGQRTGDAGPSTAANEAPAAGTSAPAPDTAPSPFVD